MTIILLTTKKAIRAINGITFLSRRLNHRGTEGTEAEVALLLRYLCVSVVFLFAARHHSVKSTSKGYCQIVEAKQNQTASDLAGLVKLAGRHSFKLINS